MSEIFDFLKKTEAERGKNLQFREPMDNLPLAEFQKHAVSELVPDKDAEAPIPVGLEICKNDKFDLTQAGPQIKSVLDSATLVGEQFRLLRGKLTLRQKQSGIKTILVTSTVPGEGKTFTASALAGIFAQESGKRAILIDADMRKSTSGWTFGLNGSGPTAGLSDVLRGDIEFNNALLASLNPEFCFLPSGPVPSNPSELLSSEKFGQTLRTAAEHFDWVIIDSPPVLSLSDAMLISPLCDTVLLVVRANSTPSKLVLDAINQIGQDHICGVVLNRQKYISHSRYYYHYYYRSVKKATE
jgi:protein-tyrosine kinase